MLICIFAAVSDLRKEIKTEENPAYATTLQVSLHTDNSIPARLFTCVCSHQITTGDKKIEMSTNLAYATLLHPATNQQLNEE